MYWAKMGQNGFSNRTAYKVQDSDVFSAPLHEQLQRIGMFFQVR